MLPAGQDWWSAELMIRRIVHRIAHADRIMGHSCEIRCRSAWYNYGAFLWNMVAQSMIELWGILVKYGGAVHDRIMGHSCEIRCRSAWYNYGAFSWNTVAQSMIELWGILVKYGVAASALHCGVGPAVSCTEKYYSAFHCICLLQTLWRNYHLLSFSLFCFSAKLWRNLRSRAFHCTI